MELADTKMNLREVTRIQTDQDGSEGCQNRSGGNRNRPEWIKIVLAGSRKDPEISKMGPEGRKCNVEPRVTELSQRVAKWS